MTGRGHRARAALRRLRVWLAPVPAQALGLAVLVALLAAALVSVPLMTGSAEEGAWERERARHADHTLGATLGSSTFPVTRQPSTGRVARAAEFDDRVADAARQAGLGTPVFQAWLRDSLITPTDGRPVRTQLLFREGWQDNVEVVAGGITDDGVLIPRALAARLGIGPGDVLESSSPMAPVRLPVAGIYADPGAPLPPFWAGQATLLLPRAAPEERTNPVVPSPAVLAPRQVLLDAAAEYELDLLLEWFVPLPAGLDIDEARAAVVRLTDFRVGLIDPSSPVARLTSIEGFEGPVPRTSLPDALASVDETVALLTPAVRAVGIGGAAAAVVLVGAWAAQRVRRRETELRALITLGLSPVRGAGHALRESLLPVALGAGAGAAAALGLVRSLGPSPRFADDALPDAVVALAVGAGAALLAVLVVTAVLVARLDRLGRGPVAHALGRIPWLAVTAAVAALTAVRVLTASRADGEVDVLTLGLPLLVTVVAAGAVTALLPRVPRGGGRLTPAVFLALRRVAAGRGAARLVVVTTALSLGLVVYAGALADSAGRTIDAKATVASPGDAVVPLLRRTVEADDLPDGATAVGTEQGVTLTPGEVEADLLVVDPEQVLDVLRWDDALADRPPEELMALLADHDGDRVPALLAGPAVYAPGTPVELRFFSYYALPIEIVGRATAFPGQPSVRPVLVVDWTRVTRALERAGRDPAQVFDRQVWAPGEAAAVLTRLTTAGYAFDEEAVTTPADFLLRPEVLAQTWSLDYVRAVALAAGALGLLGVAMHALAQQRRRTVAALLLARMGLRRRSAALATALEIGLLVTLGAVVAAAVALPSSALVVRLLDPAPELLPGARFVVPWGSLAAVLGGVLLGTLGAAALVGRAARRARAGEVLRDAE